MTTEALTEAEKMRRVPGIIFADGPAGRRARIAGTGLDVFEVIGEYCAGGASEAALREGFHWLSDAQLQAALSYYREFHEEIDAAIEAGEALVPEAVRERYTMTYLYKR